MRAFYLDLNQTYYDTMKKIWYLMCIVALLVVVGFLSLSDNMSLEFALVLGSIVVMIAIRVVMKMWYLRMRELIEKSC